MIFPSDAEQWVGTIVVLDWNAPRLPGHVKFRTNSGGRVLRVDATYLYLQPFSLAAQQPPALPGRVARTRLTLATNEDAIPLVDIVTIYPAPLEDVEFEE
jgi:hypothetical protein